ncbi:MAG: hypothetical protein KBE91_04825, partial [Bacteroidia bacterium]|nr:hypothetical protein [Bacteroidia bacterium]
MSKTSRFIALLTFVIHFQVHSQNLVANYNTLEDDYGVSGCELNNSFFLFSFFNNAVGTNTEMHLKLIKLSQNGQQEDFKIFSITDSSIKILNYQTINTSIDLFCSVASIENQNYNSLILLKFDTALNLVSKQYIGVFANNIYSCEIGSFFSDKKYLLLSLDTTSNRQGAIFPFIIETDSLFQNKYEVSHFPTLMDYRLDKAWLTTDSVIMLALNYQQAQRYIAKLNHDLSITILDSMGFLDNYLTSPLLGRFNILNQNNNELTVLGYSDSIMPSLQYRSAKRMSIVKFDSSFKIAYRAGFKSKHLSNTEDNHQYFTPWYGIGNHNKSQNYYIGADVIYTPFSANSPMLICLDSSLNIKWESYIHNEDSIVRLQYIYGSQYGGCWVVYVQHAIDGNHQYDMA